MQTLRWIWEQSDWPNLRWDMATLSGRLANARMAQGRIIGAAGVLDDRLNLEAIAEILTENGVTTSAIEGEAMDEASVRSSVARRLGLPTAGLPAPPRTVDGLIDVLLDATQFHDPPLTLDRLCRWQAALFPTGQSGIQPVRTGELRGDAPMQVISGPIGRERIHFQAPPREGLDREVERFLDWFNAPSTAMDGLVRAGLAHLWFVTLHPFEDGNGRLARAITDMALSQDENRKMRLFSLSAQIMRTREQYYAILEHTQRGDLDFTPWLSWFLEQVAAAAVAAERTMVHTLAKARFWLHHQETDLNDRQRKVLNRLLDAGPQGFEGGINTRKYMGLTSVSRATAYRELHDMVQKRCLRPLDKGGRSSAYEIDWP